MQQFNQTWSGTVPTEQVTLLSKNKGFSFETYYHIKSQLLLPKSLRFHEERINTGRKGQLYLFQIGNCAAAVSAGAQRGIHILFDQSQIIACSQLVLQEERRANTAELAMRNDGNPVPQNVCLIHVVCGENDSATWKRARKTLLVSQTNLCSHAKVTIIWILP